MKQIHHRKERGQALILIVFAIIGLIGMTALAVDGGNAYAERRRAQNAADATALDAALAKVRGGNLYSEGLARAASNSYIDGDYGAPTTDPKTNVEIYNPPSTGPYTGDDDYIQVIITATVDTYFGPVVGISQITNKVEAVARAKDPVISPIAFGNAIVSLSPHDCSAVTYQGNANTLLIGGGIYVNSDCDGNGNQAAFFNNSGSATLTTPCLQAVGRIEYAPGAIAISPAPIPPDDCINSGVSTLPAMVYPNPTCSGNVAINEDTDTMSPGNYTSNQPFPPNGVSHLEPGIYCITDANVDLNSDLDGSGVVIVVQSGSVSANGNATINLSAPTSGPYEGLLLYAPEGNDSAITINGGSDTDISGTILAPSSTVTINGSSGTFALNSQVIGNIVNLSGNSGTTINYNAANNYEAPIPPQVELVQ